MAVHQNRKSRAKRGMHNSHNTLTECQLSIEPTTGEKHLPHHVSPSGYYRGRQVVNKSTES